MTTLPDTKAILPEFDNGWLTIRFNTPKNRNALSDALAGELRATLEAIRNDRSVRGVTLRGKGGVFCAGGDLKAFMAGLQGAANHNDIMVMNKVGGELFHLINNMPQVTVALIEGAAVAGGLGMACCTDIIAVTKDAKFTLTETQLGVAPAQIAPYVVQRLGLTTARRLMLTGARFSGAEAKEIGLADYIAESSQELDEIETDIRKSVMRCAPGANAATKEIVLAAPRLSHEQMIDFAADGFARCLLSDEGREGVSSFIEKRKPKWAE